MKFKTCCKYTCCILSCILFYIGYKAVYIGYTLYLVQIEERIGRQVNDLAYTSEAAIYINLVDKQRLNRLFRIISRYENDLKYQAAFRELDLMEFNELVALKDVGSIDALKQKDEFTLYKIDNLLKKRYHPFSLFCEDIASYLQINEKNQVEVNDDFIEHLQNISNYYSFIYERDFLNDGSDQKDTDKFTIVTAVRNSQEEYLFKFIDSLKQYFPKVVLRVYDLGLKPSVKQRLATICGCDIRQISETLKSNFPHLNDLDINAWKPIIIQDSLRFFGTVLYIDCTMEFTLNFIEPMFSIAYDTGLLTVDSEKLLTCHSNIKTISWFGSTIGENERYPLTDTNFMFLHKNFLNSLIMKAWVTCALTKECIAPTGSQTETCCGCHNYDQSALAVLTPMFYSFPEKLNTNPSPAYLLKKHEKIFKSQN